MKAISIRQPWAWLIINSDKDIENRCWATNIRGRVLVHAAKGMTCDEYEEVNDFLAGGIKLPPANKLERGGIVGSIEIIDCVTKSESPWFFGPYGFVLRNPKPLPFMPMRGQLGLFNVQVTI